jgi:hypothetical protein
MNRQPKGTPVGGQFAQDRKPSGGDLDESLMGAPLSPTEHMVRNQSDYQCYECDGEMTIDENGVSHHLNDEGEIDYDADSDHVAFTDEDETYLEDDEESPYDEPYCDFCEDFGHSFHACPRRDDSPDHIQDDFPSSVEYDTSYEDGEYPS